MKYITLEESRDRSKYVPAPFNETNLSTDWLEKLCDEGTTCARREGRYGSQIMCWIDDTEMYIGTCANRIAFVPFHTDNGMISITEHMEQVIEERVNQLVGETPMLCCRFIRSEYSLTIRFYWELGD